MKLGTVMKTNTTDLEHYYEESLINLVRSSGSDFETKSRRLK
jgi:hypothetical protein